MYCFAARCRKIDGWKAFRPSSKGYTHIGSEEDKPRYAFILICNNKHSHQVLSSWLSSAKKTWTQKIIYLHVFQQSFDNTIST